MLPLIFALMLTSAGPAFEATTLEGRDVSGSLVELTADHVTLAAKEGNVRLDMRRVLTLVSTKGASAPAASVVVELIDGSTIRGRQYTAQGDRARITLTDGQTIETPAGVVRTVRLGDFRGGRTDQPRNALDSDWLRMIKMETDGDLLIALAGEGLDYHKGVLHDVTDDVVRFDVDGEVLPVKRSKVYGFVYHRGVEPELPAAVCRITDAAGSVWAAKSIGFAGQLKWTTPSGVTVAKSPTELARIDFSGGKLAYLGEWKPESVIWTPYFSVEAPTEATRRFHAPRFDRGFESDVLRLGGVAYNKGLAVRCRTEIVYRLPSRFGRFQAMAGIDDVVRPNGKVRLVIRGDDRVLLDTIVAGDEAPLSIDLELKDVRRLTILVDFAGGLGAGDRLLLCNARVLR
jgi:hypothetical protein